MANTIDKKQNGKFLPIASLAIGLTITPDSYGMNNDKQDEETQKPKIQKVVYTPYSSKVYKTFAEEIPRGPIVKYSDKSPHIPAEK